MRPVRSAGRSDRQGSFEILSTLRIFLQEGPRSDSATHSRCAVPMGWSWKWSPWAGPSCIRPRSGGSLLAVGPPSNNPIVHGQTAMRHGRARPRNSPPNRAVRPWQVGAAATNVHDPGYESSNMSTTETYTSGIELTRGQVATLFLLTFASCGGEVSDWQVCRSWQPARRNGNARAGWGPGRGTRRRCQFEHAS
jgi:hypothetical protein